MALALAQVYMLLAGRLAAAPIMGYEEGEAGSGLDCFYWCSAYLTDRLNGCWAYHTHKTSIKFSSKAEVSAGSLFRCVVYKGVHTNSMMSQTHNIKLLSEAVVLLEEKGAAQEANTRCAWHENTHMHA